MVPNSYLQINEVASSRGHAGLGFIMVISHEPELPDGVAFLKCIVVGTWFLGPSPSTNVPPNTSAGIQASGQRLTNVKYETSLRRLLVWIFAHYTWDRFKFYISSPINFGPPGNAAAADTVVDGSTVDQTILGLGGSLSRSLFERGRDFLFVLVRRIVLRACVVTNDTQAANSTFVRVPIWALDFSKKEYRLPSITPAVKLNPFGVTNTPSNVFSDANYHNHALVTRAYHL
ncbi:hypothetical protein EDB87DRAFT_1824222 [Lactarius vividus]|nr:hypothetical protein EDB87DRAFT_1824222 [Lactarius vividus]